MLIYYKDFLKTQQWNNLIYGDIDTVRVYDKHGRKTIYSCLPLSFDIETTTMGEGRDVRSYMYIWMFGIGDNRVFGTTWQELNEWMGHVTHSVINTHQYTRCKNGNKRGCTVKFFGFIENESFEYAFLKGNYGEHITSGFFKSKRQILYMIMDNITWLDSMQITGMSLAKIAENFTNLRKKSGDLDYSKKRNNIDALHMSKKEYKYCEMDVAILTEYHKYYVNTFLKNGIKQLVYTRTGIARAILRRSFSFQNAISKEFIATLYPEEPIYKMHMRYLLRGGYVHSNSAHTGKILENVGSDDLTSAHPAAMCQCLFPMTPFNVCNDTFKDIEKNPNNCYIFDVTLKNVKSKTTHSIESLSKCVKCVNPVLDNGRVHSCDEMRVLITDIDYKIYRMFYTWDEKNVEYHRVSVGKYGHLPNYIVNNVLNKYEDKERKKLNGEDYYLDKTFVNSIFGVTITRYNDYSIIIKNGTIIEKENSYDKFINDTIVSPYWGIWTTCYTRYRQLSLIHVDPTASVYGDTDSVKHFESEIMKKYIDEYNNTLQHINEHLCSAWHKDISLISELGKWDNEKTAKYFKTCGCKRYGCVYEKNNILSCKLTVAGLPKNAVLPVKKPLNILKAFKDGLTSFDCKLSSVYSDEEYTDNVNGVVMNTRGCLSLVPVNFTMGMSEDYKAFLLWVENTMQKCNNNI